MKKFNFASDNSTGIHPDIIQAIINANDGDAMAYGEDGYTKKAEKLFQNLFGEDTQSFFVSTGTAANVLGLQGFIKPYESILCAESAHLTQHESTAPERIIGCKIQNIKTPDGKLTPELIAPYLTVKNFEHTAQPKAFSISQPNEFGCLYTIEELTLLGEFAKQNNLIFHMDGARIANAVAKLDCDIKDITKDIGLDILSFGGTKNGLMAAEAVVFFNSPISNDFKYLRKQGMQCHSKMRFISAQFIGYLENDLWLKNAKWANQMTLIFAEVLSQKLSIQPTYSTDTNSIFIELPMEMINKINQICHFHIINNKNLCRFMTSFNTTEQQIMDFVSQIDYNSMGNQGI